jgi:hypothetical protein
MLIPEVSDINGCHRMEAASANDCCQKAIE